MVGGDESLKDPIFRAMIRAGELAGEVYFAIDNISNKVVGVAIWFPPGKSLEEQRALGFDQFMGKLSPETRAFWSNSYVPVVDQFLAELLGPDGTRESHYLNQLATDPAFQKMGIATLLLKTVHDRFPESGTRPMFAHCAANEQNARFYESCGYTVKGKMFMEAPTGGYPVIVLTKYYHTPTAYPRISNQPKRSDEIILFPGYPLRMACCALLFAHNIQLHCLMSVFRALPILPNRDEQRTRHCASGNGDLCNLSTSPASWKLRGADSETHIKLCRERNVPQVGYPIAK
ncbi:hypothetical protein B0H19DRAFT_553612 [Mycena capillaripes]|nr:hypothetical protein B0H19DRAFT_553612 [Mycena capillaripes]